MTLEEKGFRRTLRLQGRDLKIIKGASAGKTFRATINRIGAFMLTDGLGPDVRGQRISEKPSDDGIIIGSQDKMFDVKNKEQFKAVQIGLDSPAYSQKNVLQQLTPQDVDDWTTNL